jgi:hypothetical protein
MKPEQELSAASSHSEGNTGRPVDRRRFMESAAVVGAALGLDAGIWGQAAAAPVPAASTDSSLPDGTEFVSWEQPLTFSKTYYVDNTSPQCRRQWSRRQGAALPHHQQGRQVLQPGERVVIAAGTYRECVRPARGGTGPGAVDQL